ncbi:MAG: DUF1064 domain-containing protein [Oscillospiraceae bacterium]|nr:DUF1064 domain-containing protein [Oscillospiraceae bacterium]
MGRTKYNVGKDTSKRTYNGIVFDSELEMKYYRDVVLPGVESGEIVAYELQKAYELQPKFEYNGKRVRPITYVADFYIVYNGGKEAVIDTKGYTTPNAQLKRKMFWYHYPELDYQWIGYSKIDGGFVPYEYIKKQRAIRKRNKARQELKES